MTNKKRLIFDTTGINRFAEDRKSADPLIAGLTSGYIVRVTATNVEESIATDNADKRNRLLEVCKDLIKGDGCEIITRSLDYRRIDCRIRENRQSRLGKCSTPTAGLRARSRAPRDY